MIFFIFPILGAIKSESYPKKLSKALEEKYIDLYYNHNDTLARDKLIEHNLRLVAHIAKKYDNTSIDKDDILSIGVLGLIKAVDTFQIKNNNTLATYASRCIENEILMSLRSNKNKRNEIYLQSPIYVDKDGNEMELLDTLEDSSIDISKNYENKKMQEALNNALNKLSVREYDIIKRRFGLERKSQTQKEIANELDISRSYVSRIEKRALLKLYMLLKDLK